MALNRLACPACGAAVHSAAGFAIGQAVNCPKCESEFSVDEAAIRYAVLGVLLVVLVVLGYLL